MDTSRLKYPTLIAATGLLVGFVGDLMFYDRPLGISVPIFVAAVVAALLTLAAVEKPPVVRANLWLIVPLLFLAAMSAVRAAPFLTFLNISGGLLLLALLANSLAARPVTALNLGEYLAALIEGSLVPLFTAIPLLRRVVISLREQGEDERAIMRRVLLGLLIAAPFLCIFTLLFASADLLFSKYLDDLLGDLTIGDVVGHTFLTLALAWVVMGGLAYALSRSDELRTRLGFSRPPGSGASAEAETGKARVKVRAALGTLEASIVQFSVDALFLVFVAIQFAAHFGGEAFLKRQGLTYSEYARQGFSELLVVALITLGLILALDFVTRRETRSAHLTFLAGSGLMVAMTVVILVSAFQRLRLYELAYGFTRLRLHAHVFMVWVAALLVFFFVTLAARRTRLFATGALVAALGFVATLDALNPDAFIVRQNVARYLAGEELDVDYIGGLSADAVPELLPLLYEYEPEVGDEAGPWLHYQLDRLDNRQTNAGWSSYHASFNRAYRALDPNRDLIEQFEAPAYWWRAYD